MRRLIHEFNHDKSLTNENLCVVDASELNALYGEQMADVGDGGRPFYAHIVGPTFQFSNLQKMTEAFDAQVVVIDGASDTFEGNEISRRDVRAFMRMLRRTHPNRNICVLLLVHIDRSSARGITTNDDGYSGNSQWHNSSRGRLFLQKVVIKDPDTREPIGEQFFLRSMKNQDGPVHPDIELQRIDGFWGLAVSFSGNLARDEGENHSAAVLALIDEYYRRGQYIGTSLAPQSTTGVYATLHGDPKFPRSLSRKKTEALVRELERSGALVKETYKDPSRRGHSTERWRAAQEKADVVPSAPSAPSSTRGD